MKVNVSKIIIAIVIMILTAIPLNAFANEDWQSIGDTGLYPINTFQNKADFSMDVDNNKPIIAFGDSSKGGKASVYRFEGTNWVPVGNLGFSPGTLRRNILLEIHNGTYYAAFNDETNYGMPTVMKYGSSTGGIWKNVGNPAFDSKEIVSLKVYNDIPYALLTNGMTLILRKYNGSSWEQIGEFTSDEADKYNAIYDTKLVIDNGTPYVSWTQRNQGYSEPRMVIAKCINNQLQRIATAPTNRFYDEIDFTVLNGTPFIVNYDTITYDSYAKFLIEVYQFDGNQWSLISPSNDTDQMSNADQKLDAHFAVKNGALYLSYNCENGVKIRKYTGQRWETVGTDSSLPNGLFKFSMDNGSAYTAYLSNGEIHVNKLAATAASSVITLRAQAAAGCIELDWNSISDSRGVVGYNVYKSAEPGEQKSTFLPGSGINSNNYSDMNVNVIQTSYYIVKPVYRDGSIGDASNEVFSKSLPGTSSQVNSTPEGNWQNIGDTGITPMNSGHLQEHFSMAVHNTSPVVAFEDSSKEGKASVYKFDQTNWVPVGNTGFSAGQLRRIKVEVDNGVYYVIFDDVSMGGRPSVMKCKDNVGNSWEYVGTRGFTRSGICALKIYNGIPYVAIAGSDRLELMKFNGTSWELICRTILQDSNEFFDVKLVFDKGIPYVSWLQGTRDSYYYKLAFARLSGSQLQEIGTEIDYNGIRTDFSVSNETPYVIKYELNSSSKYSISVYKYDGSRWSLITSNNDADQMTNPEANYLPFMHIDIDQGTPYVCFYSGSGIRVRKLSGQSWETIGPDITIPQNYFEFCLANGTPYIAYLQDGKIQVSKYIKTTVGNVLNNTSGDSLPSVGKNKPIIQRTTSWTGVWDTTMGPMILTQTGSSVTGTYEMDDHSIKGSIKGDILSGTFVEAGETGSFEFVIDKSGTFSGSYQYNGEIDWYDCTGTNISNNLGSVGSTWGGVWFTDYGPMIITQVGSSFTGVYGEKYSIEGTISGTTAKGRFTEGNNKGDFTFTLSKRKKSFIGKWRYYEDDEWSEWNGVKKK